LEEEDKAEDELKMESTDLQLFGNKSSHEISLEKNEK
jgi:hypothetical protein